VAAFHAAPLAGTKPLAVSFTDDSTGVIWNWSWNFTSPPTTTQNPVYSFTSSGLYTISLRVCNDGGCSFENKTDYISVTNNSPTADFGWQLSGVSTVGFTFTGFDDGIWTSSTWTFGDGGSSTSRYPSHTYAGPGNYNVGLTYCNEVGCDGVTHTITVTPQVPWQPPQPTAAPGKPPVMPVVNISAANNVVANEFNGTYTQHFLFELAFNHTFNVWGFVQDLTAPPVAVFGWGFFEITFCILLFVAWANADNPMPMFFIGAVGLAAVSVIFPVGVGITILGYVVYIGIAYILFRVMRGES
jgi:PKD repeat protein